MESERSQTTRFDVVSTAVRAPMLLPAVAWFERFLPVTPMTDADTSSVRDAAAWRWPPAIGGGKFLPDDAERFARAMELPVSG